MSGDVYTAAELLQEEDALSFSRFRHETALAFGLRILEKVRERNEKPVRVRCTMDGDVVFQYLMDGKSGVEWLDRKERTVLRSGHSSLYVWAAREQYPGWEEDPELAVCGGGFPLILNGEIRGAFCVSGMEHTQDHAVIVEMLRELTAEDKEGNRFGNEQ